MSEPLQSSARSEQWFDHGAHWIRMRFLDMLATDPAGRPTLRSADQLARFSQSVSSEIVSVQVVGAESGGASILAAACATHEAAYELLESIVSAFKAQATDHDAGALSQTLAYQILHVEAERLGLLALILEVIKEVVSEQPGAAAQQDSRVAQVGLVAQALVRELLGLVHDLRVRAEVTPGQPALSQGLSVEQFESWDQAADELAKFYLLDRVAADSSASQVARICRELGIAGH